MSPSTPTRTERDSLGERAVPATAYYGIQTARAIANFPISGWRPYPELVTATVQVKKAAARANRALGALDPRLADAIETAADEILAGAMADQFVVDPFQAGAGTSHNMNVNEVLANRAIEILSGDRGNYTIIHPNDHVNMSQSTNDVFPTATGLASLELSDILVGRMRALSAALAAKSVEFNAVVKSGRTHLQDAVPVTLGQEFGGYAAAVASAADQIEASADGLNILGIGGTAAGTGLNAPAGYRELVVRELALITGRPLKPAGNYFQAMQSMAPFVALSGALKLAATDLIRIANDIRLLASGPNTGFGEIGPPAVQPGSSIMPGKVNPVMAEMLDMVCFQVVGNDATITLAASSGQLELNVMMPVIAFDLLMSLKILANAVQSFAEKLVIGITANRERCRWFAENSLSLVTALSRKIGYARAAEIAKRAIRDKITVRQALIDEGVASEDEIDRLLDVYRMTRDPDQNSRG